jgi:hypothetical protein
MDVVNKIKSYEDSDLEINLYKQAIREVVRIEKMLSSFFGSVRSFAMGTLERDTVIYETVLMECVYGDKFSIDSDGNMKPSNDVYDGLYNLHVLLVSKKKIQNFGNPVTEYLFFKAPYSRERYPRNRKSDLGTPQEVKANFQKNFMSLENFKNKMDNNFKNPVHSLRARLPIYTPARKPYPHPPPPTPRPTTAPVSATITQDATTLASAASPPLAATRPTAATAAQALRLLGRPPEDLTTSFPAATRPTNATAAATRPTTANAAASPDVHTQDDIVSLLNAPPWRAPAPPSRAALQNTLVRGGKRRPTKRRRATKRRKQTKRKQTKRRR